MMDNKNKCGDCSHFDEDEAWSEDDYWWFNFCDIGKNDPFEDFDKDTVACDCFKPLSEPPKEET
jgi:hypothetical protein